MHLAPTNASSTYQLGNFADSGNASLQPDNSGANQASATYVWDASSQLWRMTAHEQGSWITATFAAGNYSATTWTVASGDVTTAAYYLEGRKLTFSFYIIDTTMSGTPSSLSVLNGAWGSFTATKAMLTGAGVASNNGGALETTTISVGASGTNIGIAQLDAGTWTNATDNTDLYGQISFEVN